HHLGQSDDGIEGGALSGSCTFKTVDSATPNTLLIAGNDVQIAGSKANFLELLTVNVKRERRPPRAVGAVVADSISEAARWFLEFTKRLPLGASSNRISARLVRSWQSLPKQFFFGSVM